MSERDGNAPASIKFVNVAATLIIVSVFISSFLLALDHNKILIAIEAQHTVSEQGQ